MAKLGNNLKDFRAGLSQQALADAVGVTRLTIHSIENSKFAPTTLLALKLARHFNTSVESIFYLIDTPEKSEE